MTALTDLQNQIAQRIANELPRFTERDGWDVLTEVKGDIYNMMQARLNSLGIGFCVFTPDVARGDFVERRNTKVVVETTENPLLNQSDTGTRIPGLDLAWILDGILSNWQPLHGWSPLLFDGTTQVATPFPGCVAWNTAFVTSTIAQVVEQDYDPATVEQEPVALN